MGDPRFQRKNYETPKKPWNTIRITEENTLLKKYGLKNKRELWKTQAQLRKYRRVVRGLLGRDDEQSSREKKLVLSKLQKLELLNAGSSIEDVLILNVENFLARRLQTLVHLNGLARTSKEARQLIVHGHVSVNGRKVRVPSYMIAVGETIALDKLSEGE